MPSQVQIDLTYDSKFTELGALRLLDGYMRKEEKSPQERFKYVAEAFGSDEDHAQRIYNYAAKHWLSFSTPVLSFGRSNGGLPISCYLPFLPDTRRGLVDTSTECRYLSMAGGGIGLGIGIRSGDAKSTGVMSHLKTYDADVNAYKQSGRRGSLAAYLDISHPDILQFVEMRNPTGGDQNQKCLNLHHGVNISDAFMQIIERCSTDGSANDDWPLIDPNSGDVIQVVSAKELWIKLLETRMKTGEPYIHYIDQSNRNLPTHLSSRGLMVRQSNLCSEITLPTDDKHTAVCCLSSLNLEYWDEWKNEELFVSDVVEFLDNVLEYFICNAPDYLARAVHSAANSRDIGIGALGFHALLQKKNIPFESALAVSLNSRIFRYINEHGRKANKRLGEIRGEAPYASGTGNRLSHLFAIAPNASSSIIVGNTSPSIEPFRANAYRQDTLSGSMINKNKFLEKILIHYNQNTDEVWSSIIANEGSVQHLDFLSEYEKEVYKTALEINPFWIIQHAADRQEYIDQAQSVNLFLPPDVHVTVLHRLHFDAWKKGLKTLYYLRSKKIGVVDTVGTKTERKKIEITKEIDCVACEG